MSWISFLAIYFVAWFLSLFVMLPFGVKTEKNPKEGHEVGAPEQSHMWKKAFGASIIALIITLLFWSGFTNGWISFRP